MKYTKKLYYADFTTGKISRPRNKVLRFFGDFFMSVWYLFLFLAICVILPSALFADSYRYLKLQYLRVNNDITKGTFQHKMNISLHNVKNLLMN